MRTINHIRAYQITYKVGVLYMQQGHSNWTGKYWNIGLEHRNVMSEHGKGKGTRIGSELGTGTGTINL